MATWTLDKDHSEIRFKAKHLMITTVTGQFREYDATVDAADENFAEALISFCSQNGLRLIPATPSATTTCAVTTSSTRTNSLN